MQVKLEVVECKNSKIKQAGLWNDSKSCCSWNREGTGKPENKCARNIRNITVIIHVEFRAPSVSHLHNMESVIVLLGNKRVKRKKKKKKNCYCKVPKRLKIALLT